MSRSFGTISEVVSAIEYHVGRMLGLYRSRHYEREVLQRWIDALDVHAANRLATQVKSLNVFRRLSHGQSTGIYSVHGLILNREIPDSIRFPITHEGNLLMANARIRKRNQANGHSLRADLEILNGKVSEILFDRPPKEVFGKGNPKPEELEIYDVKILFDPMDPDPFKLKPLPSIASLPEWIQLLAQNYCKCSAKTGLSEDWQRKFITYYDIWFPADYLELVKYSDSIRCERGFEAFEVSGLSHLFSFVTPDEYVVVLAEIAGYGVLCLLRGGEQAVYYIGNESHIPVIIGTSFREALEKALKVELGEWEYWP